MKIEACVQTDLLVIRGRPDVFIEQTKGKTEVTGKTLRFISTCKDMHRHQNDLVIMGLGTHFTLAQSMQHRLEVPN